MVVAGTMEKLGVTTETVQSGRNANIYSPFQQFSPEQRERVLTYMQGFYDNFIEKAASSRKKSPEQIDAVAQGRVWTGQQAKAHGLVDELGGLTEAIEIAKARAKIAADEDVEVVVYPPRRSLYAALVEQFGGGASAIGAWLDAGDRRALAALTAPVRLFRRGEPLALMPFAVVR
jgi:protease-4